jgi:hypothetical protein
MRFFLLTSLSSKGEMAKWRKMGVGHRHWKKHHSVGFSFLFTLATVLKQNKNVLSPPPLLLLVEA